MPINILMPALSPTMEKGNLAKWLKKEGDKVKPGDVIAEIETDKATMEIEAIDEGTLAKIVVPEGTQDVPVNQLIAVLAEEGEDVKAAAAAQGRARRRQSRSRCPPRKPPANGARPRTESAAADASTSAAWSAASLRTSAAAPSPRRQRAGVRGSHQRSWRQPRLRLAARASARQGSRHRSRPHPGLRPAWPRDRARRRGGEIRQGARRPRRGCAPRRPRRRAGAGALRRQDPRAVRAGQLRGRPARQHPQDHRAAPASRRS